MNTTLKSFDGLANALAAAPRHAARRQPAPKKPTAKPVKPVPTKQVVAKPIARVIPTCKDVHEAIEKIATIVEVVYAVRGQEGIMAYGDFAVKTLMAAAARKEPSLPTDKFPIRALEEVVAKCGAGDAGRFHATRAKRLFTELGEHPAPTADGANFIRLKIDGTPVEVERIREASDARSVAEALFNVTEKVFGDLEIAKVTKLGSLNSPRMKHLRRVMPDIGGVLLLAALSAGGYRGDGRPKADLLRTNFIVLSWAEAVLRDLRNVLAEDDEGLRGEIYCEFVNDHPISIAEYNELVTELDRVRVDDAAPAAVRSQAQTLYRAEKARFDQLKAVWNSLQREVDDVQQEALLAVDTLLAYVRDRRAEKEARRAAEREQSGKPAEQPKAPRVLQPATKASVKTVQEAVAEVNAAGGAEVEYGVPRFNAAALGLTQLDRVKALRAVGLDGGRTCVIYPGVVWEAVIGPIDHAMAVNREDDDCRMVVIAPRRKGGMGVDLTEARVLMVSEYEGYFEVVEE